MRETNPPGKRENRSEKLGHEKQSMSAKEKTNKFRFPSQCRTHRNEQSKSLKANAYKPYGYIDNMLNPASLPSPLDEI